MACGFNCKMKITLVLWALIVSSASHNIDDQHDQVENMSDIWDMRSGDIDWKTTLLLNKLWNSYVKQSDNSLELADDGNIITAADMKDPYSKRFTNDVKQRENNYKLPFVIPQRKWNIKKGKGIPTMCYFKLCSFKTLKL